MGTNYYWHAKEPCPSCKRDYERLHIGKSSDGWCFSLHIIPEERINSLEDWQERYKTGVIKDEYGDTITPEEMTDIITNRSWRKLPNTFDYAANHAEPDPNNLVRHRIDPRHCIGHGEGTWDYMVGEFS
jgi:hypothetical protein